MRVCVEVRRRGRRGGNRGCLDLSMLQTLHLVTSTMRRTRRRVFLKQPEPLERAESVGVSLPAFNFVEARTPKTPRRSGSSQQSPGLPRLGPAPLAAQHHGATLASVAGVGAKTQIDCEEILYHTIATWAAQMDEPTL